MFEQHSGENMSNLISNFLDIVCSDWHVKLIGVSTDGASVMTGPVKGVATRIEKEATHKIYRVWCGLHPGSALSRAGRAPSLLARAEPNLTSARSAHERFGMASRATSEPLQWLGSARCNPSLARSLAARSDGSPSLYV